MVSIPYKISPFRGYQQESYDALWNHYNQSTILQLPTGAGKGLIICKLIIDCAIRSKSVLVLVPTIELLDNIYDRLILYSPFLRPLIGKLATGRGSNPDFPILIGVYKSVYSRLKNRSLPSFHVVISDECHHAVANQWRVLIEHFNKSWHVGFTATPARLDGRPLGLIYDNLIESKPVSWFIQNGYLADYKLRSHKTEFEPLSGFNDDLADQQEYFDRRGIIGDAIKEWEMHAVGEKTLFFCTGINHAIHVQNEFNSYFQGRYRFGYIGSDMTQKQREAVLRDYKNGYYTGLTNVGIVTEGVDIPDVACVSVLRYTSSLSLWLQMVGRSLRPKKNGKKAIILDHAGNALVHGAPDFAHDWALNPDEDNQVAGNSKICCPGCDLPVTSYKKLAAHGEKGITLTCPNCGLTHHYQHTIVERGERPELPQIDKEVGLEDYQLDPIELKVKRILTSKRLQQNKVKAIVSLNCGLTVKVRAMEALGITSPMIATYLDLSYKDEKTFYDSYELTDSYHYSQSSELLGL